MQYIQIPYLKQKKTLKAQAKEKREKGKYVMF